MLSVLGAGKQILALPIDQSGKSVEPSQATAAPAFTTDGRYWSQDGRLHLRFEAKRRVRLWGIQFTAELSDGRTSFPHTQNETFSPLHMMPKDTVDFTAVLRLDPPHCQSLLNGFRFHNLRVTLLAAPE